MSEINYNIGDWVLTTDDKIVRIISDDMPELPFEKIKRHVSKEEVKEAIYNKAIDIEKDYAYDSLNKRMYILVPYNISDIQKGIQAGHAVEFYAYNFGKNIEYMDYIENHKTWIILNGGTTNAEINEDTNEYVGTLNQILDTLEKNKIDCGYFFEPDLNYALTAVCFLADERVFNWVKYPDYNTFAKTFQDNDLADDIIYKKYCEFVGGEKIAILKEIIKDKKLA